MAARQGALKISGGWKNPKWDRRRNRQFVYRSAVGQRAIERIGLETASAAQQFAQFGGDVQSGGRSEAASVAGKVRFKDIRPWTAKKNAAVSKSGDTLLVGLVVSDSFLSMALEFGANDRRGNFFATGFMRRAALKVRKSGVRFVPANPAEQEKLIRKAQREANLREKERLAGNRARRQRRRQKRRG